MASLYLVLKFAHVVAAIVWVGGVITLSIINARLTHERDPASVRVMGRQSAAFGRRVLGPAALCTLLAGVALVPVMRAGFAFWMGWGLAGVVASLVIGSVLLRPAVMEIVRLSQSGAAQEVAWAAARRRMVALNGINALVLLSTVWAMVFKPTL